MVLAPVVAVAAVAMGLGLGGHGARRAAVVYSTPRALTTNGLAWQVVTFQEEHGAREPVSLPEVIITAVGSDHRATWKGATNADGVAEAFLPLAAEGPVLLEVSAADSVLARGAATVPAPSTKTAPPAVWTRFARREGRIALDVAVLGERVAPGFPAEVWVRARDAVSGAPLSGVDIEVDSDASLAPGARPAKTDSSGWTKVVVTPVGLAVLLSLRAAAGSGRSGSWVGGLFVSPGAPQLRTRTRWSPDEQPEIAVVSPLSRAIAYVEVDDAHGRAWATTLDLAAAGNDPPGGVARVPRLAAGLYWAIASSDPAGAARLGPGTAVRPFFVAAGDDAALAFGLDRETCTAARDVREEGRALSSCLALAPASPVARSTALEGFSLLHARDAERRARGVRIGVAVIAIAVLLEAALLLRAAAASRAALSAVSIETEEPGVPSAVGTGLALRARGWSVAVGLLVALLGFAFLAALLVRFG
jgi:hypothetical protein